MNTTAWNPTIERSPGFVYHYSKVNNDCKNAGSYITSALQLIVDIGACSLASKPYHDNDCNEEISPVQYNEALTFRSPWGHPPTSGKFDPTMIIDPSTPIKTSLDLLNSINPFHHGDPDPPDALWLTCNPMDVDLMKSYLLQFQWPIIIGFNVNSSFDYMWVNGGIWTQNYGPIRGGHCICIVGYDENKGLFKCENSWGTTGRDHGYFWVTYNLVREGCFQEAYVWVRDEPAFPK